MKLTQKINATEVETVETVLEITQEEFGKLTSKIAADTVKQIIDGDDSSEALLAGLAMAASFARFAVNLEKALFKTEPQPENNDKQEEN